MKGATPLMHIHDEVVLISIHAPMKGATNEAADVDAKLVYFNPRTHEGCDTAPTI